MSIFTAIDYNRIEEVRTMAPQQWNTRANGITPLEYASKFCRQECITILAHYGNINTYKIHPPLINVICHSLVDEVKLLLELGADPTIHHNKLYPLSLAIENENIDIIRLLLEHRVNPNLYHEMSPLDTAIDKENEPIIALLVPYGAMLNKHKKLNTVIDHNKISIMMCLLNHNYEMGSAPLNYAIKTDNIEIVRLLIQYKVPLNNSLHCACRFKNMEIVQLLLDNKANLNELDDKGNTPILSTGSSKMMRFLMDKGADITIVNAKGNSLLHNAVLYRKGKIIKLLIEHGMDINIQNNKNNTPLFKAVDHKDIELTELLLTLGADPLIPNKKGHTVKDIVHQWKSEENWSDTYNDWSDDDWFDDPEHIKKQIHEFKELFDKYELPVIKEPDY